MSSIGGVLPFPKEGIKLSSLEEFIKLCGGRSVLKDLCTTDVNDLHMKPLTSRMKSSYCDYLKTTNPNSVGEAQVFISHAWKYLFLNVVDTLLHHFKHNPDVIIWFDLFSNNQHMATTLDFEWWSTVFKSAIKQFHHTVLILSPWHNPIPLTRAWCLFEIYCTAEYNCRFEIALNLAEECDCLMAIDSDTVGFVKTVLSAVDVRKSEASKLDDKIRIFKAVKWTVGFHGINSLVFESLRDWIIDTLQKSLQNASTEEKRASLQLSLGVLYMNQGRYELADDSIKKSLTAREHIHIHGECHTDLCNSMRTLAAWYQSIGRHDDALPLYTKCIAIVDKRLGTDHPHTLVCMNDMVSLYQSMGCFDEALTLCTECLEKRKVVLGEKHPDTLTSMDALVSLHQRMGCFHEALPLCTNCFEIRKDTLGMDHPDTLVSINCLASLYQNMKKYDEAFQLYTKCLEITDNVSGKLRTNALASMKTLASLCHIMGKNDEAFSLYTRCLAATEDVLGKDHPETLVCMNALASLYQCMGRDEKSLSQYKKCLAKIEELLREKFPDTLGTKNDLHDNLDRDDDASHLEAQYTALKAVVQTEICTTMDCSRCTMRNYICCTCVSCIM